MAGGKGAQKDLEKIFKQVKKLGKKTADEGTYEDWIDGNNHAKVKWLYKGKPFTLGIANTTSDTNASKNVKRQVERGLKEIGFPRQETTLMRFETIKTADEREIEEIVEKLYFMIEEYDED
jgi:hypothetical protein